jgi:hypothetical protein
MRVDGRERRWCVRLVDGLRTDSRIARIEQVSSEVEPAASGNAT